MHYIGYTSAIAGGDDDTVFSYVDYCYGAEEDEEGTTAYPLGYFFSGDAADADFVIDAGEEQVGRQLYTQYPSPEVIERTAIMGYFDETETKNINQMWINVRCFNIGDVPAGMWIFVGFLAVLFVAALLRRRGNQMWR
jgi:spermidine/putrescine transport system substrate-binding protein